LFSIIIIFECGCMSEAGGVWEGRGEGSGCLVKEGGD
jgi:hypothetical protein